MVNILKIKVLLLHISQASSYLDVNIKVMHKSRFLAKSREMRKSEGQEHSARCRPILSPQKIALLPSTPARRDLLPPASSLHPTHTRVNERRTRKITHSLKICIICMTLKLLLRITSEDFYREFTSLCERLFFVVYISISNFMGQWNRGSQVYSSHANKQGNYTSVNEFEF